MEQKKVEPEKTDVPKCDKANECLHKPPSECQCLQSAPEWNRDQITYHILCLEKQLADLRAEHVKYKDAVEVLTFELNKASAERDKLEKGISKNCVSIDVWHRLVGVNQKLEAERDKLKEDTTKYAQEKVQEQRKLMVEYLATHFNMRNVPKPKFNETKEG